MKKVLHYLFYSCLAYCTSGAMDLHYTLGIMDSHGETIRRKTLSQLIKENDISEIKKRISLINPNFDLMDGSKLLTATAKKGSCAMLELLLNAGADPNLIDSRNHTALYCALKRGNFEMAHLLKKRGANLDKKIDACFKRTALLALLQKHKHENCCETVRWLVQNGADITAVDTLGNTPLHFASRQCEGPCIKLLCEFRSPRNTLNGFGHTPLHSSLHNSIYYFPLVSLIAHGVDLDKPQGKRNQTSLVTAVKTHDIDTIEYLLYEGACANKPDTRNKRPLDYATSPEEVALLTSPKRPKIPEVARSILLDEAREKKNIVKKLKQRELGN